MTHGIDQEVLEKALSDLAEIKDSLACTEEALGRPFLRCSLVLHVYIHAFIIVLMVGGLLYEIFGSRSITYYLHISHYNEELRSLIVGIMAFLLLVLAGVLYLVVWKTDRKTGETFKDFAGKNLIYLKKLSFLSDLFTKFAVLSVVVLAARGDWVAPLIIIFLGDFLLQRKFFVLPLVPSVCLGFLCLIFGAALLVLWPGLVLYPFAVLLLISSTSLINILLLRGQGGDQSF